MSLNSVSGKKYGLIIPNKKPVKEPIRIKPEENIFAEESDDEDDTQFKQPAFDVKMETIKASLRKSTKVNIEKALEEDASVFQYDEVYDQITRDKDQKDLEKRMPSGRKSKYVDKLLQTSAVRKLGKELLAERKAQRELEVEKEKYKDKEAFVTGAYKEKMAELRELVEQRREEEAREEVMDVTKQDGLGGFYRYMFQQKTTSQPQLNIAEKDVKSDRSLSPTRNSSPSRHEHENKSRHQEHKRSSDLNSSSTRHRHHHRSDSSEERRSHQDRRRHNSGCSRDRDRHSHRRDDRKCGDNGAHNRGERDRGSSEVLVKKKENDKGPIKATTPPAEPALPLPPPGFIHAKPLKTTDEEVEAARQRFLQRKAAGLTRPDVVLSDDED